MAQLGYYDKSYHLMLLPVQNITFVIEPVLHPILSTLQNNKCELGEKNRQLSSLISKISFPIGITLFCCGGEIIKIIYGDQWDLAIPVFKILALSLPLQMIQSTSGAIYQAAGHTNHMFYNGILNTFITVSGFFIAAYWGHTIEAMAWAFVLTLCINFIDSYIILYRFTIRAGVFKFFYSLIPQLINSLFVFIIVLSLSRIFGDTNIFVGLIWKVATIALLTFTMAGLLRQYNIIKFVKSVCTKYQR